MNRLRSALLAGLCAGRGLVVPATVGAAGVRRLEASTLAWPTLWVSEWPVVRATIHRCWSAMRYPWPRAVGACALLGALISVPGPSEAIEPVSLTAGGVGLAVSAGYAFYSSLRCKYEECCSEPWIRKISKWKGRGEERKQSRQKCAEIRDCEFRKNNDWLSNCSHFCRTSPVLLASWSE